MGYFAGDTVVHRLDPRTKLLMVIVYIVALFLAKWVISYAVMLAFLVTAVALSRIRPRALFKGLKPLLFIIIFTAIINVFYTKGDVLVQFWIFKITREGVDTVEEAEKLRNQVLYMDRDEVELEEGVYFIQDLIGLEVLDVDTGKSYGKLTDVMQTGANDVYEVKDADGKTVLIPAIPDVVQETDLDGGVMRIRPLEGLFDAD